MTIKDVYCGFKTGHFDNHGGSFFIRSMYDHSGTYVAKMTREMSTFEGIMSLPVERFYIENGEMYVEVDLHPVTVKSIEQTFDD